MSSSEKTSFEQSMKRLEEIVKQLESGNLPLEKSLKIFEEGTAIVRESTAYLDTAEQKITELINSKEIKNEL
ncbi:MAG TPA: exodeoxyribonuclease VII small subunit [Oscillospiraceae bacterium]|nr:exodeoxyribonuclease VII small subunit [Oscillospiraceae bacterium]